MEENKFPQFVEKVNPILTTWEVVRQEKMGQLIIYRNKILKGYAIASVVTAIVTMGFGLLNFGLFGSIIYVAAMTGGFLFLLSILAFVVYVNAAEKKGKEYTTQVTSNLLPSIASIYFENVVYNKTSELSGQDIQAMKFFGKISKELIIKDTLKGTVNNYAISICKMQKDRKSEHSLVHEKHLTLISIAIPLELKTPVILNPSEYNPYIGKVLNKWWNKANSFIAGLPATQDYDYFIDLHKYFTVHTSERTSGAILLQDPNYLELIELAQTTIFPLRIVFTKNKICVLLEDNTKDLFPMPKLNTDTDEQDFIKSIYNRLDLFSSIINKLIDIAKNAGDLNNKNNTPTI